MATTTAKIKASNKGNRKLKRPENFDSADRVLVMKTLRAYLFGIILSALILFLPAGSLKYWNAWLFLGIFFIPMGAGAIILLKMDPELIRRRIQFKEKEKTQKSIIRLSWIVYFAVFLIPGLDYRFGWSSVPPLVVITSSLIGLCAYFLFFTVMRQNSYASRIIEVEKRQKVIDTGLYSMVRHPMYLAACLMYMSFPLTLGSFYALIPALFLPFLLVFRIKNEEQILEKELKGYKAYMKKVKYRILPYVW